MKARDLIENEEKKAGSVWYALSCDMGAIWDEGKWDENSKFEEFVDYMYSEEGRWPLEVRDQLDEPLYTVEELDLAFKYHRAHLEKEFYDIQKAYIRNRSEEF